jgi:polypeptide N-acetylgalactosaminyltransferase
VTPGWLEPLLDRLVVNRNITAISVVETVDMDTLEYYYSNNPADVLVTGFNWDMIFNWKKPYEPEGMRRKNLNDPVASPTMLGAFFGD